MAKKSSQIVRKPYLKNEGKAGTLNGFAGAASSARQVNS